MLKTCFHVASYITCSTMPTMPNSYVSVHVSTIVFIYNKSCLIVCISMDYLWTEIEQIVQTSKWIHSHLFDKFLKLLVCSTCSRTPYYLKNINPNYLINSLQLLIKDFLFPSVIRVQIQILCFASGTCHNGDVYQNEHVPV